MTLSSEVSFAGFLLQLLTAAFGTYGLIAVSQATQHTIALIWGVGVAVVYVGSIAWAWLARRARGRRDHDALAKEFGLSAPPFGKQQLRTPR